MSELGPYESWARLTGRLHPKIIAQMQRFFDPLPFNLHSVRVKVMSPRLTWLTSKLGFRGRPTATFVLNGTVYCLPGVLDADGVIRDNLWSWQQIPGIALWAHEFYHVYQYEKSAVKWWWSVMWGTLMSLHKGVHVYDHHVVTIEIEAVAFAAAVQEQLVREHTTPSPPAPG